MNDQNDPPLLDHEADGIKEFDNKLPRWWVWLFYITIAFSAVYLVYYHVLGAGQLIAEEYSIEMERAQSIKQAALAKFQSTMETLDPVTDPTVLAQGQQKFLTLCAPCHGQQGQGLVGPNLTDDYWIHGSEFSDNLTVIFNGVPEKGMISWKDSLKPSEILAVSSYIYTLRGTDPPNPKPPENQAPAAPAGPSPFE